IKSYKSFTAKNQNIAVLVSLDHVLRRDFDRADMVLKTSNGIALKNSSQVITYTFSPDFVTRETGKIDTFKVQAQEMKAGFENIPVEELQTTGEQNRLDELAFILIFQNEKIPFHYRKLYSSDNLIKRNPNAVN